MENCFLLLDTKTHGKVNEKDLAYIKSALLLRRQRRAISQRLSIPRDADFVLLEQSVTGRKRGFEWDSKHAIHRRRDPDAIVGTRNFRLGASFDSRRATRRVGGIIGRVARRPWRRRDFVFPEGETVLQAGEGADTFTFSSTAR